MQISIIKYSNVLETRRFDAEFYKPEYLKKEKIITNNAYVLLGDVSFITDGIHDSIDFDKKSNILLVSAKAPKENTFNISGLKYISERQHKKNPRTSLKENDIIISTVGTIGNCAVVTSNLLPANSDRHVGIIRPKEISSFFISTFLLSKYGRMQTRKFCAGNVQPNLYIQDLKKIKIPVLQESFQLEIEKNVKNAHQKQTQSKQLYKEAEELLLKELGLLNYKSKHNLTFETTKKEVEKAGRFDSEYFQPEFLEIIEKIENYSGGFDVVENQFNQNKSLSKKNKEFYNYIEISDVNITDGEITPNKIETKDIPANGKRNLYKNDLLISKVRPYRGAVSFIDFETGNLLGSGAFVVLQEKSDYKKEVLMIFLKTFFIKDLLLRYNCGTSYPVIKDEDILNLKIPLIKPKIQKLIAEKIQESHKLRKESKELLETAKRKVEEEIEKKAK
ncbi:MAG: restriction endonuclease subunit S [Alphaproteobacteria bacterium]